MNTLAKEKVTLVDTRIATILEELLDLMAHNRANTDKEISIYCATEPLGLQEITEICNQLRRKLQTNCTADERSRIVKLIAILKEKIETRTLLFQTITLAPQALLHR